MMAVGGDGVLVTCRSRGGDARDAWAGGAIAGAAATDAARCRRGSRTRRRATCRSGRPTELACRWRQGRHAAASARALPAHASRPLVVRACSSALRLLRGLVCNGGGGNAARDSKRCGARRQGGQAGEWSSDNPFDEPVDGAAQRRASTVGSKALRSSSRKHAIYYWKGMYTWNVRRQTGATSRDHYPAVPKACAHSAAFFERRKEAVQQQRRLPNARRRVTMTRGAMSKSRINF